MTEAAFNHSLVKEQVDQIVKELKRLDEPLFSELKTLYTGKIIGFWVNNILELNPFNFNGSQKKCLIPYFLN